MIIKTPVKSVTLSVSVHKLRTGKHLSATLYHGRQSTTLAFFCQTLDKNCCVHIQKSGDTVLWLDSTAFDIAPSEASRVAAGLEISIDREDASE